MKIAFPTQENKRIKVYRAVEGSVRDNLERLTSGKLPVFTHDQTCAGHGIADSCPH